jgi:osmotically-inducible protein OsmY
MKTDAQLQKEVVEALHKEPSVTAEEIGVLVHNGAVVLSGVVPTYAEKYAAEQVALRVCGVRAVAEEIQVEPPEVHQRSDEAIAEAVSRALQSHVWVPDDVKACVEQGWVTLQGEVDFEHQKDAAMNAVRFLAGIKGIYNLITVRSTTLLTTRPENGATAEEARGSAGSCKVGC